MNDQANNGAVYLLNTSANLDPDFDPVTMLYTQAFAQDTMQADMMIACAPAIVDRVLHQETGLQRETDPYHINYAFASNESFSATKRLRAKDAAYYWKKSSEEIRSSLKMGKPKLPFILHSFLPVAYKDSDFTLNVPITTYATQIFCCTDVRNESNNYTIENAYIMQQAIEFTMVASEIQRRQQSKERQKVYIAISVDGEPDTNNTRPRSVFTIAGSCVNCTYPLDVVLLVSSPEEVDTAKRIVDSVRERYKAKVEKSQVERQQNPPIVAESKSPNSRVSEITYSYEYKTSGERRFIDNPAAYYLLACVQYLPKSTSNNKYQTADDLMQSCHDAVLRKRHSGGTMPRLHVNCYTDKLREIAMTFQITPRLTTKPWHDFVVDSLKKWYPEGWTIDPNDDRSSFTGDELVLVYKLFCLDPSDANAITMRTKSLKWNDVLEDRTIIDSDKTSSAITNAYASMKIAASPSNMPTELAIFVIHTVEWKDYQGLKPGKARRENSEEFKNSRIFQYSVGDVVFPDKCVPPLALLVHANPNSMRSTLQIVNDSQSQAKAATVEYNDRNPAAHLRSALIAMRDNKVNIDITPSNPVAAVLPSWTQFTRRRLNLLRTIKRVVEHKESSKLCIGVKSQEKTFYYPIDLLTYADALQSAIDVDINTFFKTMYPASNLLTRDEMIHRIITCANQPTRNQDRLVESVYIVNFTVEGTKFAINGRHYVRNGADSQPLYTKRVFTADSGTTVSVTKGVPSMEWMAFKRAVLDAQLTDVYDNLDIRADQLQDRLTSDEYQQIQG
jgi:hypothetical protein